MFNLPKPISISLKVGSIVSSAILWYFIYKYIYQTPSIKSKKQSNNELSESYKIIKMKIPLYTKGAIIGKNGSNIKRIQERTKTTIKFSGNNSKNEDNLTSASSGWNNESITSIEGDVCYDEITIRGLTIRVLEAEKEIKNIVANCPIHSEDVLIVDNRYIGKIIGKGGENIKRLKEQYNVQLDIDRSSTNPQRKITIRGILGNIKECKADIYRLIDSNLMMSDIPPERQNQLFKKSQSPSNQNEQVKYTQATNGDKDNENTNTCVNVDIKSDLQSLINKQLQERVAEIKHELTPVEELSDSAKDSNLRNFNGSTVINNNTARYSEIDPTSIKMWQIGQKAKISVSSVVDGNRFYAQFITNQLDELETLIVEMTNYFGHIESALLSNQINVGDILAGFYEPSVTWQRVKVISILENEFEVIYLDYGDTRLLKASQLREFIDKAQDFLILPFQAVKMILSNISPINDDEQWSEQSIIGFENLTKVGQEYPLTATLVLNSINGIEVILSDDINREDALDISNTMINSGYAKSKVI